MIQKIRNADNWTDSFFAEIEPLYSESFNTVRNTLVADGLWDRFDRAFCEWKRPGQIAITSDNRKKRRVTTKNGAIVPASSDSEITDFSMKTLDEYTAKDPEWLIDGWIPKYQITVMCADGGAGKTSLWCHIAAKLSTGDYTIFEQDLIKTGVGKSKPLKVAYFTSEDSIEYTLKARLEKNGVNIFNTCTIDMKDKRFPSVKFNSEFFEKLIEKNRPDVAIFDPLQSFIPPNVRMGQRNEMRNCMNPLIALGEKYKVTPLIVMHTNKQSGMYGRKRMADSSDIWDIARSVIMLGETSQEGIRYISQEKSNYGPLQETILFEINDSQPIFKGYSKKRDREFITEYDHNSRLAPQRDEAKEFILDFLKDGEKEISDLDEMATANGISKSALKRAKAELKKEGRTKTWSTGYGETKKFYIHLLEEAS